MRLGTSRPPVPPMGYNPAVLRPRELVSVTPGQPRLPPPLPPPQLIVQGMWSLEPRKLGRGVGGQKKREGKGEGERLLGEHFDKVGKEYYLGGGQTTNKDGN